RRINSHAGLFSAVGAICDPGLRSRLCKSALAIIVIEQAGRRIIGYVKVQATVPIVVQPQHSQTVIASFIYMQFVGHVGERSVAIVVIEPVAASLQSSRTT